ncbi:hypothetical protein, conserved [Eimeria maxima]|uniref:50S ribosomal protein L17 n=1 Tax=Eimeria maxima TaxID=5804 RepID=U6M5N6_EIMMA|nr:hypothetical protein, conserved [Eimeria maxima]CDJ57764.1 hypothetical protein, conserved [Eimeria maxima]
MRAHVRRSHSRLGRPRSHRKALLRNLATQLIRHGSIITTAAKGKELRRVIDSKIILAKKGGLHNYRQALGFFYDKKLTRKLFQEAPTRFARRNNGFSRLFSRWFPAPALPAGALEVFLGTVFSNWLVKFFSV